MAPERYETLDVTPLAAEVGLKQPLSAFTLLEGGDVFESRLCEREFVTGVSAHDLRAPGVYGMARQRWNEEHLFTRFVRNLYFPYKPLAGGTAGMTPSSFG